jgi:small-conductance mechanosensitive channel
MKKIAFVLMVFALSAIKPVFAQKDTARTKSDSVLNIRLENQSVNLQRVAAARIDDSLKAADLQSQIALLKSSDQLRRVALVEQLNKLKSADSLRQATQLRKVDSLRHFVKGFAVAPFGDTLFFIFTRQGSFTPQERAGAITARIAKLAKIYNFSADTLKIISSEQTADISYRDNLLLSVSYQDGLWQNAPKEKVAVAWENIIAKAVVKYREETSWSVLLKEGLLALLVIVAASVVIYIINRLTRWALSKTHATTAWYVKGFRIRNYELVNPSQALSVVHTIIKVIKWVLIVIVVYLALPVLFGIFPFTRDISATLLGYVVSPLKRIGLSAWDYIPNLITIIVLVVIFRYVLKFFRFIKTEIERGNLNVPGFYPDWANPTYQILRVLILAFMLIVIFPYMPGYESPIFKGVSVFVGVLFTFGSAGALGNIVAGLVLTYMRAFKLGDRVKIGEVTGDIIGKSLLVTRVRTIQNEVISIPNSTVMSNHTVNYSTDAPTNGLIVHTTVTIGYDAPWRQVHQLLIDAALATPMIAVEPKPYVFQTSLDDYYVSYRINAYTNEPNKQALIYSNLHQNIQDEFNKAGVEIMSPHYKALRDGNATAIPPEYLPKDYTSPGFKTTRAKDDK